jgi:type IV pilus assembly protein PilX
MTLNKIPKKQQGAVLVVGLMILLVLSILSISTVQTTLMQEKMTFAVRDVHMALEAADLGIMDGESYIETLVSTTDFNNTGVNGLYASDSAPSDYFADLTWQSGFYRTASKAPSGGTAGKYYIEELGLIDEDSATSINIGSYGRSSGQGDVTGFRVFSHGRGKSETTERILISYYGKRL